MAALYVNRGRYAEALPLVRTTIANKTAKTWPALPVLFGREAPSSLPRTGHRRRSQRHATRVADFRGQSPQCASRAVLRGHGRLAQLVRRDQDLASEGDNLDKAIIAAASNEPSKRDAAAELRIRDRIAAVAKERNDLQTVFTREFPNYAALSRPEPLTVKDIQPLLAADEALVVVDLAAKSGAKSYVWAITRSAADWKELAVAAPDISKAVSALRAGLDFDNEKPFDTQASFELYRKILAPVEDMLRGKPRLSIVLTGALTSLPPQLLVARDPTGKALKDVDWLLRTHAVTVLPSIASLKVLRGKSAVADAKNPLIGFANPVFDRTPEQLQQNVRVAAEVTASRGLRGAVADIGELRRRCRHYPRQPMSLEKLQPA